MKVLVIDDDPLVGRLLARLLAPHAVTLVTSAEDALPLAEGGAFELLLCDLSLPAMTGAELHAALARRAPGVARRMVFVTGGATRPDDEDFLTRVPVLEKPFSLRDLQAIVAAATTP